MKILWHSTCPWGPSSYSVLTKRTVPDIVRMGHEVCVNSWYGLQGEPQRWPIRKRWDPKAEPVGVVTILPSVNGNTFGVDTIKGAYEMFKADVCISCMDVWVMPKDTTATLKFAPWFPVDHDPCPPGIRESLQSAIYPMSFSKWGVDVLKRAGIESHYMPCSADASVFRMGDKAESRKKLQMMGDTEFVVSMVAANKDPSDRKGFGEGIQAFAKFAEKHEKSTLYIHTHWGGPINIANICERVGIRAKIMRPDPLAYALGMYDDKYMRDIYVASDVILNPAKSEGFGLPLLEAQMCGTPIISTDFSTTDELLFAGWKVSGQQYWSPGAESFRVVANIDSIVDALEQAYENRGNEVLQKKARTEAMMFNTETIAETYWKPALKDIEDIVTCKTGGMQLVQF